MDNNYLNRLMTGTFLPTSLATSKGGPFQNLKGNVFTPAPNPVVAGPYNKGGQSFDANGNPIASPNITAQNTTSTDTSNQWNQIQPADLEAMTQQAILASAPYYKQLLDQAGGDFQGAVKLLQGDYQRGVRWTRADLARQTAQELDTLQNALQQTGLSNLIAQQKGIGALNQRGMAVGQMTGPTGFNALAPSGEQYNMPGMNPDTFNASFGSVGATNAVNPNAIGRGGYQLQQMQADQLLRQQALMRASNQNLQNLGVTAQKATNPALAGKSLTDILNTNPSELGSQDLALVQGYNQNQQAFRNTAQQAAQQQYQNAAQTAANAAALGNKTIASQTGFGALQQNIGDFIKNQVSASQSGATV